MWSWLTLGERLPKPRLICGDAGGQCHKLCLEAVNLLGDGFRSLVVGDGKGRDELIEGAIGFDSQ